jgi:hypothetical protein
MKPKQKIRRTQRHQSRVIDTLRPIANSAIPKLAVRSVHMFCEIVLSLIVLLGRVHADKLARALHVMVAEYEPRKNTVT